MYIYIYTLSTIYCYIYMCVFQIWIASPWTFLVRGYRDGSGTSGHTYAFGVLKAIEHTRPVLLLYENVLGVSERSKDQNGEWYRPKVEAGFTLWHAVACCYIVCLFILWGDKFALAFKYFLTAYLYAQRPLNIQNNDIYQATACSRRPRGKM